MGGGKEGGQEAKERVDFRFQLLRSYSLLNLPSTETKTDKETSGVNFIGSPMHSDPPGRR